MVDAPSSGSRRGIAAGAALRAISIVIAIPR